MNKPVAWYAEKFDGEMVFATSKAERGHLENKGLEVIPLYTHPPAQQWTIEAKFKELTDEEIWDWFKENTALTKESALMIAKAILRKAQENV